MVTPAPLTTRIAFPSQVPVFAKPPGNHIQSKAVQLYFVRGWSLRQVCLRYGLRKKIVQNLLSFARQHPPERFHFQVHELKQ